MATYKHPITGVTLNEIIFRRENLDEDEAVTVHILAKQYEQQDMIAHQLGVNQGRVNDVLKGRKFPNSAEKAAQLLQSAGETFL
ncbi:hypothetical protein [uncultured Tateyamaria sp.]|uniref:hypothetical protein n=1 Tax=uncultured Tateyamaria sp. TaxID=455651 RepID=UPI0026134A85|nr:hypothetical protein [uncultured Tateyamaria sp.]